MLRLIKTYDLDGFISDDILAPPKWMPVRDDSSTNGPKKIENEDYKAWKRSDTLLGSWILGTLSDDLLPYVVSLENARALWIRLQTMLSQEKEYEEFQVGENISKYLPLLKAIIGGDWESAMKFLEQNPDAVRVSITEHSRTALIVAASLVGRINFVKKLVELMSPLDLALVDYFDQTALHRAAGSGNIEAAKLLVSKNPDLPNASDIVPSEPMLPIHVAARRGKGEMVLYL
uniref:Uncharacterized protein n=1 Tax=Davidia involucrata TaxID=16924 RepID=A0A5B7ACJ2_DAVIN